MNKDIDQPLHNFEGQIALVTGAGRGVGRAVAEALAACGARVAANDITPINLDETMQRISAAGGRAKDYVFDVAKRMPVETMVAEILEDFGEINLLVSCAGVRPRGPVLDMDDWDWLRVIEVNLGGPFFTMQHVGRSMKEQGGGAMLIVGDAVDYSQSGDYAAYAGTQAGLSGLVQAAAADLQPYNIHLNLLYKSAATPTDQAVQAALRLLASPTTGQIMTIDGRVSDPPLPTTDN